jgi:hypothetical protein
MADHLDYRIIPQKRSDTVVDRLIISIKNKILSMSSTDPNLDERALQRRVSGAVARHCHSTMKIITTKGTKLLGNVAGLADDVLHNTLCVAVALADEPLILELLGEGASLWTKTKAFGYPLNVAIQSESTDILDLIIAPARTIMSGNEHRCIVDAIKEQEKKVDWKRLREQPLLQPVKVVMRRFVNWCVTSHWLKLIRKQREILFEWTIALEMYDAFKQMLSELSFSDKQTKSAVKAYFKHPPNKDVFVDMFHRGMLDKQKLYRINRAYGTYFNYAKDWIRGWKYYTSVLDHAVFHRNEDVAYMALTGDRPASANGCLIYPSAEYITAHARHTSPLRLAVANGHKSMVRMLLLHHADPEGIGSSDWEPCILRTYERVFGYKSTT